MRSPAPPLVLVLALAACGGSAAAPQVVGSGNVVTRTLAADGEFRAVRVEGAITVEIATGGPSSLSAEADENLVPLLRAEVRDGTLRLWTDGVWQTKNPFRVRVRAPAVTSIVATGAVRVKADVLRGEAAEVTANGSAEVEVGEVAAKSVKADARGATNVRFAGKGVDSLRILAGDSARVVADVECTDAVIAAQGAADVRGVKAKTANVMAAGAVRVDLDCERTLKMDATGSSSIRWGGDPELSGTSGAGTKVAPRYR